MSWQAGVFDGGAEAWDQQVAEHGWMYQLHGFGDVLATALNQRIVRLHASRGGQLQAGVSLAVLKSRLFGRFAVSLPVSDHSGVWSTDEAAAARLLEEIEGFARREGLDHVELRHLEGEGPALPLAGSTHKVTLQLDLPQDPEELWTGLKAKVRNLVRKGEKGGLSYERGGAELMEIFYSIYARNLRDLGTPCYPRRLFEGLMATFAETASIHVAKADGAVIAVGFTVGHRHRLQIPFAASLRSHRNLSPNMFLYWNMLRAAIEDGYTQFDFGRSTRESGTWRFKRQWGAQERALHWMYQLQGSTEMPELRADSPKFRLAVAAWQKLPVPLTTWLGPRIVRHLP